MPGQAMVESRGGEEFGADIVADGPHPLTSADSREMELRRCR